METKFTKGPWTASNVGYYTMVFSGGVLISEISSGNSNAHLIAAAPDMYTMLQAHIAAWDNLYPSDVNDVEEINIGEFEAIHGFINKTKLLLAKARGESNE
ncbi:MAG: hypothetical protein ACI9ES_002305 [Oceanospirillaceae bacterium]|jgi:hypothetical protein